MRLPADVVAQARTGYTRLVHVKSFRNSFFEFHKALAADERKHPLSIAQQQQQQQASGKDAKETPPDLRSLPCSFGHALPFALPRVMVRCCVPQL